MSCKSLSFTDAMFYSSQNHVWLRIYLAIQLLRERERVREWGWGGGGREREALIKSTMERLLPEALAFCTAHNQLPLLILESQQKGQLWHNPYNNCQPHLHMRFKTSLVSLVCGLCLMMNTSNFSTFVCIQHNTLNLY